MKKRALITGILGQDGSYMAELLYNKGYEVSGVVGPNGDHIRYDWLRTLVPDVILYGEDLTNKFAVEDIIIETDPDEIYNFAGYSNVFNPWNDMDDVMNINAKIPQNILESIVKIKTHIKFFQASSCLIFGKDECEDQDEDTAPSPLYPYGITKLYADYMVKEFRDTFGVFACSGIFFPHESERRSENFFTRKVTKAVARIKNGSDEKLKLGDISAMRDYGYAPDYMEAVYLMMTADQPQDYVIGSGRLSSVKEFLVKSFNAADLDYREYIQVDDSLSRKKDVTSLRADITKIETNLNWTPTHSIDDIVSKMVDYDIKNYER